MDQEELDFSSRENLRVSESGDFPSSCSMDSFLDELLKDAHACTHAHTCNPPGPDNSHTHTCYHVHTKILPSQSEDKDPSDDTAESLEKKEEKKRPAGNREAVRKYREKKKARTASLEEEVVRLKALNQQLFKRLQGQAVLEAEIARLKCLLVDIRGRIEGEIGSFPYQKPAAMAGDGYHNRGNGNLGSGYVMNPCNLQCDDQVYCLHPGIEGQTREEVVLNEQGGIGGCEFENLQCFGNQNLGLKELVGCGIGGDGVPAVTSSSGNKRKGTLLEEQDSGHSRLVLLGPSTTHVKNFQPTTPPQQNDSPVF